MLTRPEIVASLATFEKVFQDWLALEEYGGDPRAVGMFTQYHGRYVRRITPWLVEAAEALFAVCDTDQIDEAAWPLVRALDVFDDALTAVAQKINLPGADVDPNGGNDVWRPFDELKKERDQPRVFRDPEPIPQLRAMRNPPTPEQICKMYRWYDQYGMTDVARLQREIDQPGSEFNSATWVNPWEAAYRAELATWWEQRSRAFQTTGSGAPVGVPVVRETLEELVLQGTNRLQIHKMIPGVTDEEIDELILEYGVTLDGGVRGNFMDAMAAREQQSRRAEQDAASQRVAARKGSDTLSSPLSTVETYADLGQDAEARVLRMAEDGHKASHIAGALKNQLRHPISAAQVGRIVAAHKRAALVPVES